MSTSLRNPRLIEAQLNQQLRELQGFNINQWTANRRSSTRNLTLKTPATAPELATAHRLVRLYFGQHHLNWTLEQWRRVLFSDEARMCTYTWQDRRQKQKVYRRLGERSVGCCFNKKIFYKI